MAFIGPERCFDRFSLGPSSGINRSQGGLPEFLRYGVDIVILRKNIATDLLKEFISVIVIVAGVQGRDGVSIKEGFSFHPPPVVVLYFLKLVTCRQEILLHDGRYSFLNLFELLGPKARCFLSVIRYVMSSFGPCMVQDCLNLYFTSKTLKARIFRQGESLGLKGHNVVDRAILPVVLR